MADGRVVRHRLRFSAFPISIFTLEFDVNIDPFPLGALIHQGLILDDFLI
jgi:hypothetical protein